LNLILNAPSASAPNVLMDLAEKHPGITHVALLCPDIMAVSGISASPVRTLSSRMGPMLR
jgi:hypothetical protein